MNIPLQWTKRVDGRWFLVCGKSGLGTVTAHSPTRERYRRRPFLVSVLGYPDEVVCGLLDAKARAVEMVLAEEWMTCEHCKKICTGSSHCEHCGKPTTDEDPQP